MRRVFREFADGRSPRAIARQLNAEGVAVPGGKLWIDATVRGHDKRRTGLINNQLYIGKLVWNRLCYVNDPRTGKRVSRLNPPEAWITAEVPELRIDDDALWQAVKQRQGELATLGAKSIEARRAAASNALNDLRRPKALFSGLLGCGCCGGPISLRDQNRYACSTHIMNGSCSNGRTISRTAVEERVLAGLRDPLMAGDCRRGYARLRRRNQSP